MDGGNLRAEVTLEWGDGVYRFALKGKEIEELEFLCGAGFGVVYQRVTLGAWAYKDLYQTIRLGLIGGGMGAVEAKRLTDLYIQQPLVAGPNSPESVAGAVLGAIMVGVADLPPGKTEGGAKPPTKSTSQRTARRSSKTE